MPGKYYEAIVQVRPRKKTAEQYIETAVQKAGNVELVKKKVLKTGADYYLSSWKFSVSLSNELVKKLGGYINVSRKLFGRNREGKIVYRCTVLYRPNPFDQGDIVASGNAVFLVTCVGKRVIGRNLATGRNEQLDLKEDWQKLKIYKAVVSSTFPHLEVISPEDYQSVAVENPGNWFKKDGAKVVLNKGKVYLVG